MVPSILSTAVAPGSVNGLPKAVSIGLVPNKVITGPSPSVTFTILVAEVRLPAASSTVYCIENAPELAVFKVVGVVTIAPEISAPLSVAVAP